MGVLRPPGGGSSDIFGIKGDQEQEKVETPVQDEKDNLIPDDPKFMSTEKIPNNANQENKSEGSDIQERETEANKLPAENSVTRDPSATAATSSPCPPVAGVRGRIPPGGHSSGSFW